MVKIVGVTGGICSGKSTFCGMLAKAGGAHIDCDKLGHESYLPRGLCHDALVKEFGEGILERDGSGPIDRKALGSIVFGSKEAIAKLNAIVWPAVYELSRQRIEAIQREKPEVKVIFVEAALLLEAAWAYELCTDGILFCYVPLDVAKERLMKRNNFSAEEAERRIRAQRDPKSFEANDKIQIIETNVKMEEMECLAKKKYEEITKITK